MTIFFLLILLIFVIPAALIGVYVYRDASRRGMDALLWTLVAAFAPALIGFIIYLLVRGNYSNLKCPRCATPVTEQFVVCPQCGVKLKPSCPNCSAPVESDWKLCPKCASPLPEQYEDIEPLQRMKDNTLGKVLLVLIIVPVLLIAFIIGSRIVYSVPSSSSWSTMTETDFDTLYSTQETSDVQNWLESRKDDGTAYVMQYTTTTSDGDKLYYYLLYVPEAGKNAFGGTGMLHSRVVHSKFFLDVFRVELEKGEADKETVYCIEACSDNAQKLELYLDGEKLDCEITEVDFNPVQGILRDAEAD